MALTTAADLVNRTLGYLYSGYQDAANKLSVGIDADDTALSFSYELGVITGGAVLSVDLEKMRVWDTSASMATVERAWQGTTGATHAADAIVYINPVFSQFDIFNAVNDELAALSSPDNGLFQVEEVTITYRGGKYGYDLTGATDVLGPLEAHMETPGPAHDWPRIALWDIQRHSDTVDFPSGYAVVFKEDGYPGRDMRVTYAAPFTSLTTLASTIASTGLPATAYDIPPLGAAMRLQSMREPQRNFNEYQGDSRRAGEVPPGSQVRSIPPLALLYDRRIKEEARRLKRMYPKYRRVL